MSGIMSWLLHMCVTWSRGPAKDLQVACSGSASLLLRLAMQHSNCIACAGQQPSRIIQQVQSTARQYPEGGPGLQQVAHACTSQAAGHLQGTTADLQGMQAAATPAALTSLAAMMMVMRMLLSSSSQLSGDSE